MTHRSSKKKPTIAQSLYASGEILSVFTPHLDRRSGITAATQEIANARLALAIRERPPEAVAIAILTAHRRGRKFFH
ncbi:MAG: hypothetical protein ABL898_13795 [Hyphomicrobiaceae bacterium]